MSFGKRNVNAGRVEFGAASLGVSASAPAPAVSASVRVAPPAASAASDQLDRSAVDVAWLVLEAANDLDDEPTVEACRRIIDASLNGKSPSDADLIVVTNYFR